MVNKGLQNEGLCSMLAAVGQIKQSGHSCFTCDVGLYRLGRRMRTAMFSGLVQQAKGSKDLF